METIFSIFNRNKFNKNKKISFFTFIDPKCKINDYTAITRMSKLRNTKIGSFSYVGTNANISNCHIGRYCSIGPFVKIGLGKHPTNLVSTSPIFYNPQNILNINISKKTRFEESAVTIIKNDVWLGANSIIMDGITIGNGAIVAANAVVTKNVPDYSIVAGVPAKVVKYRFDENTIEKLLATKWWEKNAFELEQEVDLYNDVKKFLEVKHDE